ncbi:DUF2628 domain-containing protein [Nibribacter ruber]|uniref:DUF2628 domain-containing protein n=1 Tax=Nibribacter ruber TaxID=2698458 RepID=A0A6P1P4B1_9BACT|nr:DUF2628 domain-containing protein [Nibribacter ruber]QHL89195.1 DUF2628 domain-containing protein [Nibribacter ruber]
MLAEDKEIYYRTYFGQSHDYYYDKLEQYQAGHKFTFNFYAFFLGLPWLLYRKMNRFALFLILAVLSQTLLEGVLIKQGLIPENYIVAVERVAMIFWGLVTGGLANFAYIRQAHREVEKAIATSPDEETALAKLSQRGGVTFIPHIILAVMVIVMILMNR